MNRGVPQGSKSGPLLFLLYIYDIKHAIGCDNVKLIADDPSLVTNDRNIDAANEKASDSEKTNFLHFRAKNKPILDHFDCIQTAFFFNRVKCVQFLGLMTDENLYWHMHVKCVYTSLVEYFGIFNQGKSKISKSIARQLYFAFTHLRIKYGLEIFGDCATEHLQKTVK